MAKADKKQKTPQKKIIVEDLVKKEETPVISKKKSSKIFFYAFILIVIALLIYFGAKFFLAASVNGQLVSRLSVIKALEKQGGRKILDDMILKILITQEAKKRKITVTKKDLDAEIKKIETNITSQGMTLDQLLQQQGMSKSDLIEEVNIQMLLTKMIGDSIKVSEKEIDEYIDLQKKQLPEDSTQEFPREQVKATINQQKLQEKAQSFIAELKAKAKINYFIEY